VLDCTIIYIVLIIRNMPPLLCASDYLLHCHWSWWLTYLLVILMGLVIVTIIYGQLIRLWPCLC